MAHDAEPSRVRGDVAADLAPALRGEVERDGHVARVERGLEVLEHAPRLGDARAGVGVDGEDLVHARQPEHDLVVRRHRAADEAGVAALGDDREAARVAVREDEGDLARRARKEERRGAAAVLARPILVRRLQGRGVRLDAVVAVQNAAEVRQVRGKERRVRAARAGDGPAAHRDSEGGGLGGGRKRASE